MSDKKILTKVRVLLTSTVMVFGSVVFSSTAHAADCSLSVNAQLPSCKSALTEPNKGSPMQEVPQDLAWVQKNAGKNTPPNNGAPQAQSKSKRQGTRAVLSKCTKGRITLNITDSDSCPAGFRKK
jgi:hypothetical protein